MIEVMEAQRILTEATAALDVQEVELDHVTGHVLAKQVRADRDFPPTDRSAMDGFAVRSEDLTEPGRTLRIAGELQAGQPVAAIRVERGQAVRIFTGAIVPPGADSVVMVERTKESRGEGTVTIETAVEPGQHVRKRGQDLEAGRVVLEPGRPIHAPEIAALASVGRVRPAVFRKPRVFVLSTGDEVVEPDRQPEEHQIRNSNAGCLLAQLRELGLEGEYLGTAADDRQRLDEVLSRGLSGDVLLVTGGVSAGEYDLVGDALADAGMRLLFHKVAVKPGKPLLAGRCGSCLVFGLPGNPVSVYTCFAVFVAPALRRLMGYRRWENLEGRARLEQSLRHKPGRLTYHLARLWLDADGFHARPVETTGSGDVLSMSRANGFIVAPAEAGDPEAGAELPVLLWRDFHLR